MRFTIQFFLAPLLLATAIYAALNGRFPKTKKSLTSSQDAQPQSQSQVNNNGQILKQMTRHELTLRANHPNIYFGGQDKRDDPTPTGSSGGGSCCPMLGTCSRRRDNGEMNLDGLYVLSPGEAMDFFVNQGRFEHNNGSIYSDIEYIQKLKLRSRSVLSHRGFMKPITDKLGRKLLDVAVPFYKKWQKNQVGEKLFHLSHNTAFSMSDVDTINELLLANPDFEEVQILGWRISREFLEVVKKY